jgi:hypothetical protein
MMVGQKDDRAAGCMVAQKVAEPLGGTRIHSGEWLVEHQQLGPASEGARKLQPPALAR